MNTELKPGMMAMIIGSIHEDSDHIGKIVTLKDCGFIDGYGEYWRFEQEINEFAWRALSKHLMPINQDPEPLHTKEEQHASS